MVDRIIRIKTTFDGAQANKGISDLEKQAAKSAKALEQLGTRVGQSLVNVGRNLTMYVTLPILGVGVASLKVSADFETGMNRVRAITGATGDEFVALRNQAEDLGATTQYTAKQAADAMGFLAMAGFEANEVLGAMPSTLQLAAAGQMELADAADIASNILTGYRFTTEKLSHANDVLVKTFTSTNTNLYQLGEAMKYAAPIASAANVQFEEAAAAIGLFGNAGIQGSMAGTTLRGAIDALINPTSQEQEAMDLLGVSALDAAGNLRPLHEIVHQLEVSGAGAGEILEIFGLRAGPGMAALVSQGSDALRNLTNELVNSQGVAEDVAKVQMEGLNGALLKLKSAFEGLLIAIGDSGLLDYAIELTGKLTNLVSQFKEMSPAAQKTTLALFGLAAAIGPALIGIGKLTIGLITVKQTLETMNVANLTARLVTLQGTIATLTPAVLAWGGAIAVVIGAIAAMKIGLDNISRSIRENAEITRQKNTEIRDSIIGLRTELNGLNDDTLNNIDQFVEFKRKIDDLITIAPNLIHQIGLVEDENGDLYDSNGDLIDSLGDLQRIFNNFSTQKYVDELQKAIDKTYEGITITTKSERRFDPATGFYDVIPWENASAEERRAILNSQSIFGGGTTPDQNDAAMAAAARQMFPWMYDEQGNLKVVVEEDNTDHGGSTESGGGGPRSKPTAPVDERLQEWLRLEEQVADARRVRISQLEHLTELGLTQQQVEDQFRSTIQSVVQDMLVLNEAQELTAEHSQFMNLWLGFLGLSIQKTAESIVNPVDEVMMKFNGVMAELELDMDVAQKLGVYQDEKESYLRREINALRDVITQLEQFKQLGMLTYDQQDMLQKFYDLFNVLQNFLESLMPNKDEDTNETVEDEVIDPLIDALSKLNENFQLDLARNFSNFIQRWLSKGGEFDAVAFGNTMFSPVADQWAGDIVKQWGLTAGFIDPVSGVIAGLAGFALNKIFGGDDPLKIEGPVDVVIKDVDARLRNVFNWQGMDPFTYSSRYRGVYESGLYG